MGQHLKTGAHLLQAQPPGYLFPFSDGTRNHQELFVRAILDELRVSDGAPQACLWIPAETPRRLCLFGVPVLPALSVMFLTTAVTAVLIELPRSAARQLTHDSQGAAARPIPLVTQSAVF